MKQIWQEIQRDKYPTRSQGDDSITYINTGTPRQLPPVNNIARYSSFSLVPAIKYQVILQIQLLPGLENYNIICLRNVSETVLAMMVPVAGLWSGNK